MIPFSPLTLDSMIRPPDAPNPDALVEAGQPPMPDPGMGQVVPEASPQQRTMPVKVDDQQLYLQLGLAGNLSQDQIDALQQALADALTADEQRAEQMQKVRSKEPSVPAQPVLPGNTMPLASQPGAMPGVGMPSSGPAFTHGHN